MTATVTIYTVQPQILHVAGNTSEELLLAALTGAKNLGDAAFYTLKNDAEDPEEQVFLDQDFLQRLKEEQAWGAEILNIATLLEEKTQNECFLQNLPSST